MLFTTLTLVITLALFSRIGVVLISGKGPSTKRAQSEKCSIAVFLGSGGHSTEMLQLIQALPEERYTPRIYLTSEGDQFSVSKAMYAEQCRHKDHPTEHASSSPYQYIQLPRARNVHQSWLSTPISLLISFYTCIKLFVLHPTSHQTPFADVIFLNGPGTCVPIVMAIWLLRILGRPSPRMVYIESFARVRSLSLTAKLVHLFVDSFIVQWPDSLVRGAQYRGWLV